MKERRKVDLNEKNRHIRLWSILITIGLVLIGIIATGTLKVDQIDRNKEDIEIIVEEQKIDRERLIRIDENVKTIKEDISQLKAR